LVVVVSRCLGSEKIRFRLLHVPARRMAHLPPARLLAMAIRGVRLPTLLSVACPVLEADIREKARGGNIDQARIRIRMYGRIYYRGLEVVVYMWVCDAFAAKCSGTSRKMCCGKRRTNRPKKACKNMFHTYNQSVSRFDTPARNILPALCITTRSI
jgi:hypothetical protein